MAKAIRILLLSTLLVFTVNCRNGRTISVPETVEGLIELNDTLSLGLEQLTAERITLPAPEGYSNNVLLTYFKGRYYSMWQHSGRDEDSPDTQVLYSTSTDTHSWTKPEILSGANAHTFSSPGGWIQRGDSLCAVINRIRTDGRKGGEAWYVTTNGKRGWGVPRRILMADGSPLDGIFEQDPLTLPSGRTIGAAHFGDELEVCPLYTDDPSGLSGWKKAAFPKGDGKPLEPSQYQSKDGSLVMLFRDQLSSFRKLFSVSRDDGSSWSASALTAIPDSRSKQCAGNLPDGRAFMVWNPSADKSRKHLAIAVSEDGVRFNKAWLIAGPSELPLQRKEGKYKTLGYNYPKASVIGCNLWISLSVNKEDVTLFRIGLENLTDSNH